MTERFVSDLTMALKVVNDDFPVFLVLVLSSSQCQPGCHASFFQQDRSALVPLFQRNFETRLDCELALYLYIYYSFIFHWLPS